MSDDLLHALIGHGRLVQRVGHNTGGVDTLHFLLELLHGQSIEGRLAAHQPAGAMRCGAIPILVALAAADQASHQIFKTLFPNDYGVTQKSSGVHYYKANSERNKPISDWEEWQANTLGAAILLPENLIKQGMFLFNLGDKIECLNKIYSPEVYKRFEALADFLGCSKKALAIRMKQLGLLKKEYLDNPFDIINIYPEGCSV